MREVRFYLMVAAGDDVGVEVFRDVRDVVEAWVTLPGDADGHSAFVHAGFDRPDTDDVLPYLQRHSGRVLVSAAARWLLPPECEERPEPEGVLDASERLRALPLYLATAGWGYEIDSDSPPRDTGHVSAPAPAPTESVESVRAAFARALGTIDRSDPFAIARVAPGWLCTVPIPRIGAGTRCENVLDREGLRLVGDLADVTSGQASRWWGFSVGSVARLTHALLTAALDRALETEFFPGWAGSSDAVSVSLPPPASDGRAVEVDRDDPFDVLAVLPEAVLDLPFDAVPLTARCENVIRAQGLGRVADLRQFSSADLLRWNNFGRTSLRELARSLVAAAQHLHLPVPTTRAEEPPDPPEPTTLLDSFRSALDSLDERAVRIATRRSGLDGPRPTLQELADELGITRERVRQIEISTWKRTRRAGLHEALRDHVDALLARRDEPLYADLLHLDDPWFEGVAPQVLDRLLRQWGGSSKGSLGSHGVIDIGGRPVVAPFDQTKWDATLDRAREAATALAGNLAYADSVRTAVEATAAAAGAPELGPALFRRLRPDLHYGRRPSDDQPVLVAVGGTRALVRAALYESPRPVHLDALLVACQRRDPSVSYNAVHNACMADALRFGRGTYGTEDHVPLDAADAARLADAATEVVETGPPGRQWHAAGLLDDLLDTTDAVPDVLDKYLLDIILQTRSPLTALGRMTWSDGRGTEDRIEIMEAARDILRAAGSPLPKDELLREIAARRGTGDREVLSPTDEVVRTSPGQWGLVGRDARPSPAVRDRALDVIHDTLAGRGTGLHESELVSALRSSGVAVEPGTTGYGLFNLLHLDPRLHGYQGRLVGLAAWGEPRRRTLGEATDAVVCGLATPTALEALLDQVEALAGRPVNREAARGGLSRRLVFDRQTSLYRRRAEEEDAEYPSETTRK